VTFSAAAHLDVSSIDNNSASGTIVIRGGQVHIIDGAQLNSDNAGGNRPGGMVTITATDLVRIAGSGSVVSSSSSGSQPAGRVSITAPTVLLEDGSLLRATAAGPGAAGDIVVRAPHGQIHLTQGAQIRSDTAFLGPNGGTGGNIRLEAHTITLGEAAQISAQSTGTGQAGSIQLQAATITLRDGALVSASSRWTGDAGAIYLRATEIVLRTRSAITTASAPFSPFGGGGRAGDIQVHAGRLSLTGGSRIDSSTAQGGGPGGMISVTATETIFIAGGTRNQPSALSSSTTGEQDAGQIEVTARTIRLEDGGRIQATTAGSGRAGTIQVRASEGQVSLTRGAQILSTTNNAGGQGGNILLDSGTIALSEGALISTRSTGAGNGGNIRLTAETLTLRDRARISAESTGSGDAGTIRLTATNTFRSQNSTVTTEANQAQGGEIQITAHNLVYLQQSQITTTVAGGDGRAGNITIDSEFVVLQNSQANANAADGPGGNITLTAQVFLADPASAVTASSDRNIDGEISIQAPVTNLSSIVAPLPQSYTPATELLRDQCAARWREGMVSSLVMREREGIPATPEGLLPGRRYEAETDPGRPTTGGQTLPGTVTPYPGSLYVEAAGPPRLHNWSTAPDIARAWQWPCTSR
jgi:large exoprotein involved in heme utilization and adhesion